MKVTNDLLLVSDSRFVSMLVLLDLSAAIDTVNHLAHIYIAMLMIVSYT